MRLGSQQHEHLHLEAAIYDLLYELKSHPFPFLGTIIDYSTMKSLIRPSLNSVARWEALARAPNGLPTRNLTQYTEASAEILGAAPDVLAGGGADESPLGIRCSDKIWRADSLDEAMSPIEAVGEKASSLGDAFQSLLDICGH